MQLQIGSTVGDYEVVEELGAGGMGEVYKVRNLILDRFEAMKVLLSNHTESAEDRFFREIKVVARLQHANIARLYTAIRIDNQLLMVMEFVDGATLESELKAGPLPVRKAVDCMIQVLSALSYSHSRGVIHRDVKPANIMLTPSGVAKLMDFGISKATSDHGLTVTGTTLGSPQYMSPEQIRGASNLDGRVDIYSSGVTLYELVTGKRIFDCDSQLAMMTAHLERMPIPPISLNPSLPKELSNAILKAVAKNPDMRFQTADEFRAAIEPVIEGGTRKQRWWALVPIVGVVMALSVARVALKYIVASNPTAQRTGEIAQVASTERPDAKSASGSAANRDPTVQTQIAPVIDEFSASESSVQSRTPVALRWIVRGATQISIPSLNKSALPLQGTLTIQPDSSKTYTIDATGPGGHASRSVAITITAPLTRRPNIKEFGVSQSAIHSGEAVYLRWNVIGAKELSIDGIGPSLPTQGDRQVCPTASKTYILRAMGLGGLTADRTVDVSVTIPAGKSVKLISFQGNPTTINAGESAALQWKVENAESVWINPEIGKVEACGTLSVRPSATTEYRISYENALGTLNSRPLKIVVR